jgi:hypothetical protein
MAGITIFAEIKGGAPKVNDWLPSLAERPMREVAASISSKLLRATISNSWPEPVSATLRVVRSNSRDPSWVSSSRIETLNPDGVMNRGLGRARKASVLRHQKKGPKLARGKFHY